MSAIVAKVTAVRTYTDRTENPPRERVEYVPAYVTRSARSGFLNLVPAYSADRERIGNLWTNVLAGTMANAYPEARGAIDALPDSTD